MTENYQKVARDPHREPGWRWTRAGDDRVGGHRDPWVIAARRFRRGLNACRSAVDRDRLADLMPAVCRAHTVWRDGGLPRAAVEARVLAGESILDIARKAGMPMAVVSAYEALFFDVRSRLGAADFVAIRLLRPAGTGDEIGATWRFFGYVGGPVVLDAVIGGRAAAARPGRLEDVTAFLSDLSQAALIGHLAAALRGAADPAALATLVRSAVVALAGRREDPGAQQSTIEMHIKAMLNEIPWGSGTNAEVALEASCPALAAADRLAAELRDDEVMRLAAGEKVAELAELAEFKMPPPRRERVSPLTDPSKRPAKG